jgi:hypothetical protein
MLECLSISDPTDIPGTREVLHYNLAYKSNVLSEANLPAENNTDNSWNLNGYDVSENDFEGLDINELAKARGPHGELPDIKFMKLANNSKLKGLGFNMK